jgi:hypothetical protein
LQSGPHYVEVSGERDSALFQDDPVFGLDATTSRTATWVVNGTLEFTNVARENGNTLLTFLTSAPGTYTVQYKDSLDAPSWNNLQDITAASGGPQNATDTTNAEHRFYRVISKQ